MLPDNLDTAQSLHLLEQIAIRSWSTEDTQTLDVLLDELVKLHLTPREALVFTWCAGKQVLLDTAPTDSMLHWIRNTFFWGEKLPMRDWSYLSNRMYDKHPSAPPKHWARYTFGMITDENCDGFTDFPEQWMQSWAASGFLDFDDCHARFIIPALSSWPAPTAQRFLGQIVRGIENKSNLYRALIPGKLGVVRGPYLTMICKKYWPGDKRWDVLEALEVPEEVWLDHLLNHEPADILVGAGVALPDELSL